jgi:hypothetical protein
MFAAHRSQRSRSNFVRVSRSSHNGSGKVPNAETALEACPAENYVKPLSVDIAADPGHPRRFQLGCVVCMSVAGTAIVRRTRLGFDRDHAPRRHYYLDPTATDSQKRM